MADDVVGSTALRRVQAEGVKRHQLGRVLEGETPDLASDDAATPVAAGR